METRAPCTRPLGDAPDKDEGLQERVEELQESQPLFQNQEEAGEITQGRRREWRYPDPQDMVYAEVDNTDFNKRYKYTTFAKSQDRRMFRAVPRRIAFFYGNKILLKDDNYRYPLPHQEDELIEGEQILFKGLYDRVSDNLYNPRQLLTTGFGPVLSEVDTRIMW